MAARREYAIFAAAGIIQPKTTRHAPYAKATVTMHMNIVTKKLFLSGREVKKQWQNVLIVKA